MLPIELELPKGFLEEEVRCGYTVSTEMKALWAVELDLLAKLLEVCRRHNIKIFASGGTMLGAVRHNGFIPWDDDVDMMMFRADYEKLCQVAAEEFQHPYFFQTEYTDRGSLRGHAQLRNSLTTGMLVTEKKLGFSFNQGIFLDIFPLDTVVEEESLLIRQGKRAARYKKLANQCAAVSTRYIPKKFSPKQAVKWALHKTCKKQATRLSLKYYKKFEEECQRYNTREQAPYISTLSFQFDNRQHFKLRSNYETLIDWPFEFLQIPIGAGYEDALTTRYGNYREFVMGGSCHGGVFFAPEKPYTEYL